MSKNGSTSLKNALKNAEKIIVQINRSNGWYDERRTFGEDIALLHSEVSEMLEAYRDYGLEDYTETGNYHEYDEYEQKDIEPRGFFCVVCGNTKNNKFHGLPKPEGVGSEAADILIRLLDTCARYKIDLAYEFIRKSNYNRTRGYRHGGKKL